jgi:hypothetical protein
MNVDTVLVAAGIIIPAMNTILIVLLYAYISRIIRSLRK